MALLTLHDRLDCVHIVSVNSQVRVALEKPIDLFTILRMQSEIRMRSLVGILFICQKLYWGNGLRTTSYV